MHYDQKSYGKEIFRGVLLTQVVFLFHVVVVVLIALMVLFLRELSLYFIWILLGVGFVTVLSAYLLYRRIKSRGRRALEEMMNSPVFRDRDVEVNLLGGLISMKVGRPHALPALEGGPSSHLLQLEDPDTVRIRELTRLAELLEKQLITLEEFELAKRRLLGSDRQEGQKP